MKIEISKQRLIKACDDIVFDCERSVLGYRDGEKECHRLGNEIPCYSVLIDNCKLLSSLASSVRTKIESDSE